MPKSYNTEIIDPATTVKACISNAPVSFKRTRETCSTLRGRTVEGCLKYLENVLEKKECVPMRRYASGCGNTPQARKFMAGKFPATRGKWPVKAVETVIKLVKNIKNNALIKNLNPEDLVVKMVSVNKAPIVYGRVYRAYGRVNSFNKSPCHIQMVCVRKPVSVEENAELVEAE